MTVDKDMGSRKSEKPEQSERLEQLERLEESEEPEESEESFETGEIDQPSLDLDASPQVKQAQHAAHRQQHQPLDEETAEWISVMLERLSHSKFRSSFHLSQHDLHYALEKGPKTIDQHAHDFLRQRLGAAHPLKDGRQTPWRGHPVFTAQHATATCCRGCMNKWHHVPQGRPLSDAEIDRFSALIMAWIIQEVERAQSGE
jgi:hypothetical protein